jgi:hypothetical protein
MIEQNKQVVVELSFLRRNFSVSQSLLIGISYPS